MARKHNTNKDGGSWTEATKKLVWNKGVSIPGYSQDEWRRDKCGTAMQYSQHGNRDSTYGWEIDHINPVANNGSDDLSNLQPMNWANNASKGDKLDWKCS